MGEVNEVLNGPVGGRSESAAWKGKYKRVGLFQGGRIGKGERNLMSVRTLE